jgi:hypothetical protein
MAIAHICLACGWDLARVRVQTEPHYGLPIVICPRCDAVSVRRVHPIWKTWKTLRRIDWALTVLLAQIVLALGLTAANLVGAVSLAAALHRLIGTGAGRDIWWFLLVPTLVIAPITGAWLTAGFSHLKANRVWLGWVMWLLIVSFGALVVALAVDDEFAAKFRVETGLSTLGEMVTITALAGTALLAVMTLCAVPGILIGRGVLWSLAHLRAAQWRWRRRMARRARVTA